MSLVNGDRVGGRVTFVWPDTVLVIWRRRIMRVTVDGSGVTVLSDKNQQQFISLGPMSNEGTDGEREAGEQRAAAVYRSIVSEDGEVVWTRVDGGWIRVPDAEEV